MLLGMGNKNTIKLILLIFGVLAVSSLVSNASANAIITFTATQSGDWNDPTTWGDTAPPIDIRGDKVVIPFDIIVTIPSGVTIDNVGGTIDNSGTIRNFGDINNFGFGAITNFGTGTIENSDTGTINNSGRITNSDTGTIDNSGTITNFSTIENSSTITNSDTGTIENSGTIRNSGRITNSDGTIGNSDTGTIENSGRIINSDTGTIDNNFGGLIRNSDTGTINNSDIITNSGTIENSAFINNFDTGRIINSGSFGTIENSDTGIIRNFGDIRNFSDINNSGRITNFSTIFNNFGTIRNSGEIVNDGGTIDNSLTGTIENSGFINNSLTGTIDNRLSGIINNDCNGTTIGPILGNPPVNVCVICGDGLIVGSETCDDDGRIPGDGCSAACQIELGFSCTGQPSVCTAGCGDGRILGSETCDDDGRIDGDGCSATCQTEAGFNCKGTPSVCIALCGDGLILGSETCDDDNAVGGDGCSAACQTEAGFSCIGQPSVCSLLCGNTVLDPGEQCDDGNASNTDACLNTCQAASCGDSFVQAGVEECDPPSAGICDLTCKFVTSSSGTVVGFTEVPRFCGLKQMAVVDSPVPPGDFAEVSLPLIFAETVDLQVSNEQTLRVANTGGGDAEVNADLTLLDTDGETTNWEDLLGATFDRSNTRSHHLASQPFSSMTPITNNPFIDVLLGQTAPESEFVDRFLKVRPNAGDAAFSAAGTTLITFTQVLRLEVSCDPVAFCPGNLFLDNGACVVPFSCLSNADCDDGNLCTDDSCDLVTGCANTSISCVDNNECTADSCDPRIGCQNTNVLDGTSCEGVSGQCVGGVCKPLAVICICPGVGAQAFCVDNCDGNFFEACPIDCTPDQSGLMCFPVDECIPSNG